MPTLQHVLLSDKFREINRKAACEYEVGFVDTSSGMFCIEEMLDGFHLNQPYADKIAEVYYNSLVNYTKLQCF